MKTITTIILAALLATFLFPAPAEAAGPFIGKGSTELGLDVGGSMFDDEFEDDTATRFGARVGYFLTDNFELELEVARTDLNILESDLNTYMLNAGWNFQTGSHFVPYVQVGAGMADYQYDEFLGDTSLDDTGLALKGAVGTRIFFGEFDRVALRLEAGVQSIDVLDETETAINFGAGVVFRFGE